jgi:hypothetical protein
VIVDLVSDEGLTLAADGVSQVLQLTESSADFIFATATSWTVCILPFWYCTSKFYLLEKFIFMVLYSDKLTMFDLFEGYVFNKIESVCMSGFSENFKCM